MQKAGLIFFISWLLCGCSIENICDDPHATLIFIAALAVVILTAAVITNGDDKLKGPTGKDQFPRTPRNI